MERGKDDESFREELAILLPLMDQRNDRGEGGVRGRSPRVLLCWRMVTLYGKLVCLSNRML